MAEAQDVPTSPSPEVAASMLDLYDRLLQWGSPEFRMYVALRGLPVTDVVALPRIANLKVEGNG